MEIAPSRIVKIGKDLPSDLKGLFIEFLCANMDIFAWAPSDMPSINLKVIAYKLQVDPSAWPIQQKKQNVTLEEETSFEERLKDC